ncbi:hypothetical protein, partial [Cellulomonas cellasea]
DPQAALRAVLHATLGALRADEAGRRGYDAVSALHLAGAPTQESAARRLGVPFSTFRRHLALGVRRLCDALWELEVHGLQHVTGDAHTPVPASGDRGSRPDRESRPNR